MRFATVSWTLSKYIVFYKLTSHRNQNFGMRLKLAFEHLGITYVKIGQILSMRYDLLSRTDCESLQQLLDNVNPIPYQQILQLVEKEYGKTWHQVFQTFEPTPLGSASVSQVHKAQTFDGKWVAVKIKRPNVDAQFLNDIKIMRRLATIGQWFSPTLRNIQTRSLVNYFEGWIKQDLDFVAEVQNMKKIKEQYSFGETNFRSDLGKGVFPLPSENLCTKNIIVMDFIDGIPLSRKQEILDNPDYDVEKSIRTYLNAAMRNYFSDDKESYIFQGDPHLSNILALPHGDAANIDFGLISELTKQETKQARDLVIAVYLQDIERVLKIATSITEVDYKKYEPMLRPGFEVYMERTRDEGLGFWFLEFTLILVRYGIKFPLYLTTFGRTNILLDGLIKTYLPNQTTIDLVGEELKRRAIKETLQNVLDADWLRLAYTLSEKVKESPNIISNILNDPLNLIREVSKAINSI